MSIHFTFFTKCSLSKNLYSGSNSLQNNQNIDLTNESFYKNLQQIDYLPERYKFKIDLNNKISYKRNKRDLSSPIFLNTNDLDRPFKLNDNDPLKNINIRNEILSLGDMTIYDYKKCKRFLSLLNDNFDNITNLRCVHFYNANELTLAEIKRLRNLLRIKVEIAFILDSISNNVNIYKIQLDESKKNEEARIARIHILKSLFEEKEQLKNHLYETKKEFDRLIDEQTANKTIF
ncbi:hypothetical protein GVAV_000342 [Gurleya vavrai]